MYLDSDTKVIISGAVILLVGIIVWKKQSFFIALVFCVLCFVFCVLCFVFCVLCFVFCVLCFVFCVLCFVFCVLCFVYQSVYDVFSDSYAIILGRAGKFFLFYISCY